MTGAFDYTLDDIRPRLAQWNLTLNDDDLTECNIEGVFYRKALAELKEALMTAGYAPNDLTSPVAYQRCHDILAEGICLYYIEGRSSTSYPDGFNPIAGAFSRYRAALRSIAAGERLGELSQKAQHAAVRCCVDRRRHGC